MRTIASGAAQKRGVNCLKLSHTKDAARMRRCGDKEPREPREGAPRPSPPKTKQITLLAAVVVARYF